MTDETKRLTELLKRNLELFDDATEEATDYTYRAATFEPGHWSKDMYIDLATEAAERAIRYWSMAQVIRRAL